MDDKFLDTLKTFSVKDIIEDVQRPTTSTARRLKTATTKRGPLRSIPLETPFETSSTSNTPSSSGIGVIESIHRPGTSMVSNRPPSVSHQLLPPIEVAVGESNLQHRQERIIYAPRAKGRPGTTFRPSSSRTNLGFSTLDDDMDLNIPDLADVAEEEFTQTVAAAPEYEVQRLTSLRELDAELAKNKSFCVVDGIDLRKLARRMVPERKLVEMDDVWTYNSLYSELAARFEERRTIGVGNDQLLKSQK